MTLTISRDHYKKFDEWARARNGNPYGYGGAFTRDPDVSTDCSGLVLQTGAFLIGRTDWPGNRYGSTESFRLDYKIVYDLGFRRGARPPINPIMRVGLQHGGGGIYSHTACTVYGMDRPGGPILQSGRGVDWESQGNGVFYYDGARGWNDGLFHDFWYLDAVLAPVAAAEIINEIDACAKANPWLGKRRGEGETRTPDGQGRFARFDLGYVYWSPNVRTDAKPGQRAVAVPAQIFDVWARQGWEKGPLGYPSQAHVSVAGGLVQAFQRGAIYRPNGTPGFIMHGAILTQYAKTGFEKGPWGWPVSDEKQLADGVREQKFTNTTALWHPSGVVTVKEA
ncbi:MAG: hypothetical protein QM658_09680 [Gordonia sp. (in: high G+C Gram-positive bacteria)]